MNKFLQYKYARKCFLQEIFITKVIGLSNVCHRNNSGLLRILLKKIAYY